jgi:hypothetical protein
MSSVSLLVSLDQQGRQVEEWQSADQQQQNFQLIFSNILVNEQCAVQGLVGISCN